MARASSLASLFDGISKTIEWYLANRPWWEHILSGDYQNYYQKMYGKRLQDATQE